MNIVKNIIVIFENQNQHQLKNISGVATVNQQQQNNIESLKELLNESLILDSQQQQIVAAINDSNDTKR